jgi:hypothetical protein
VHDQKTGQYRWYYTLDSEGNSIQHDLGSTPTDPVQKFFDDIGPRLSKLLTGFVRVNTSGAHLAQATAPQTLQPLLDQSGAPLTIQAALITNNEVIEGISPTNSPIALRPSNGPSPLSVQFNVPNLLGQVHGDFQWFTSITENEFNASSPSALPASTSGSAGDLAVSSTNCGTVYIDPSGTVVTTKGRPIASAKVVLRRSDSASGPLSAVPNGSPVMSPENRRNPDLTTPSGLFGWDVIPGFYQVFASRTGCRAAGPGGGRSRSPILQIPPPATNLQLVLNCPRMRYRATRTRLMVTRRGSLMILTAVTTPGRRSGGKRPVGTVSFYRGRVLLGSVALNRRGTATLVASRPPGAKYVIARFSGDGLFAPSHS